MLIDRDLFFHIHLNNTAYTIASVLVALNPSFNIVIMFLPVLNNIAPAKMCYFSINK